MKDVRRAPRQPAGWHGMCSVEGETAEWRACWVVDISVLGLGIEVQHPQPSTLVGRHISVEVPPIGHSVNIHLMGEIKNAGTDSEGTLRVGIEFVGLSEAERVIIDVLALSRVAP